MHALSEGGYGRAYEVEEVTALTLAEGLKKELLSEKIFVYGAEKKVRKVASFCGAGCDEEGVRFALSMGADVIVSADFKHHVIAYAIENGLAVIQTTHYASENYGFKKYYEKIRREVGVPCFWHENEELL
jgi:putative NIF3 family GTP cyclohydrolase 1 type 2